MESYTIFKLLYVILKFAVLIYVFTAFIKYNFIDNVEKLTQKAETYYEKQEYKKALKYYLKAEKKGCDDKVYLYSSIGVCNYYIGAENNDNSLILESINWYDKVLSLEPNNATTHICKAYAYEVLQEWKKAKNSCLDAIKYGHENVLEVIKELKEINNNINDTDEKEDAEKFISACDTYINKKGNNYYILNLRAKYLIKLQKYSAAIQDYKEAMQIKYADECVLFAQIGNLYFKMEDYTTALDYYNKAKESGRPWSALLVNSGLAKSMISNIPVQDEMICVLNTNISDTSDILLEE